MSYQKLLDFFKNEGIVLLENDGILPLKTGSRVAIVGEFAEKPRYQGAGSSMVNPTQLVSAKDAFDAAGIQYTYQLGYHEDGDTCDEEWEAQALAAAADADVVLFFGGLTEMFESEGFDRRDLSLPSCQLRLIEKLSRTNENIVAVMFGGSAFEVPFADKVNSILGYSTTLGRKCTPRDSFKERAEKRLKKVEKFCI